MYTVRSKILWCTKYYALTFTALCAAASRPQTFPRKRFAAFGRNNFAALRAAASRPSATKNFAALRAAAKRPSAAKELKQQIVKTIQNVKLSDMMKMKVTFSPQLKHLKSQLKKESKTTLQEIHVFFFANFHKQF